jgi:hypothetical protein
MHTLQHVHNFIQVHNKPVYNRLQSSNAGDGQSFQSRYVHTEEVKQTTREVAIIQKACK